ncbi:MAG TPA: thioesterase family protein [Duganella sp.]|jgi:acyl-CoA thioesterase FadM
MARIKLELPAEQVVFSTQMTVRSTDINAANHLGNESLVAMLSEARALFLAHAGVPDMDADGAGTIVTDLATTFRAEAHARDQLRFDVGLMDFNRYGGDITFRITRPADGALIALAKYGFVFFNYTSGQVTPMPPAFLAKFPNVNRVD